MADIHISSTTTNLPDGTPVNIAEIKGAIDGTTVSEFEEEMLGFLDKGTPNLILEFAGVSYINSTGMGLLVKCADKFQEAGGDIKLVGVSPKISALFDMLGLLSLFKIFDAKEDALKAIKGVPGPSAAPPPPLGGGMGAAQKAPPPPPPPPAPGNAVSFPVQYKCDRPDCCSPLLPQAGKYKCPSCKILIMVDGQGTINTSGTPTPPPAPPPPPPAPGGGMAPASTPPPSSPAAVARKIVDLKLPCEQDLLESLKGVVAVLARAIGGSQVMVNELNGALINAATLVVNGSAPTESFQVIFVADGAGIQIGLKTTNTPFTQSPQFSNIQSQVDRVEVTALQPKGQMLKLIKARK